MGRHRNDPLGHGRYVIAVGAVVLLLVLIGVAVFALRSALATKPSAPSGARTSSAQSHAATDAGSGSAGSSAGTSAPVPDKASRSSGPAQAAPTLQLSVTGDRSRVFVRIPGGDVLLDDTLSHGRHAEFDQNALDVVIYDGGAVQVTVNGKRRPMASAGQRVQFTARGNG